MKGLLFKTVTLTVILTIYSLSFGYIEVIIQNPLTGEQSVYAFFR